MSKGFEVLGLGMIMNVGHDQDANGSFFLGGEHLLQGCSGLAHHQAIERALGVVLTRFVRQDEDDRVLDIQIVIVVVPSLRVADAEACEYETS